MEGVTPLGLTLTSMEVALTSMKSPVTSMEAEGQKVVESSKSLSDYLVLHYK